MGRHAARRSSRSGSGECAGQRGSGQWRQRPSAGFRGVGERQRIRPRGSRAIACASIGRNRSWPRYSPRPQSKSANPRRGSRPRCADQAARHRSAFGRSALQPQSDRRHCRLRPQPTEQPTEQPTDLAKSGAVFRRDNRRIGSRRLSRAIRGRRWACHPQCGRVRGAGTRFRARQCYRLFARARTKRHVARSRLCRDLFPADGGCRPISDHGKVSRAAQIVGPRCDGVGSAADSLRLLWPRRRGEP